MNTTRPLSGIELASWSPQADSFMVSCREREAVRAETLQSIRSSDWPASPQVIVDDGCGPPRVNRTRETWRRAIACASASTADFVLLIEDDLIINRWLWTNLKHWKPLQRAHEVGHLFASLYNPSIRAIRRNAAERYFIAHPRFAWGAQALIMTPRTAALIEDHWDTQTGHADEVMSRIAGRRTDIYYHIPSLVDHRDVPSTWGCTRHRARDFSLSFRVAEF